MKNKLQLLLPAVLLLMLPSASLAQDGESGDKVTVSGSIQSDILVPTGEQSDGSNEDFRTNTYVDVNLTSKNIDAGARFEYLEHPMPGFENDFKGWGVPYAYLKLRIENAEFTAGNFYEQFGSGFILRTYEERSLGIDNSLLGGRLTVRPFKGVKIKVLSGVQRYYWAHNNSWITGADMELSIDEWSKAMRDAATYLTIGASWVNKYEKASDDEIFADATHKLVLPDYVNAYDLRANLQKGGLNILGEYAYKTEDPSFDNGYIYRKGYVAMLSASYSKKGFSLLLQGKRSDNFSFRSRRTINGTSSYINHLPAFTEDHTYTLAALYPYATNATGEWAYQAQIGYNFKRRTAIGGRYGMLVKVNFSHVHAIDQSDRTSSVIDGLSAGGRGTDGYGSAFWKWGDHTYYQDINVQIERRLTKTFKLNLMYMNQLYNKTVVEGEGGNVRSDIFIADGLFTLSPKTTLRAEVQYLTTDDDDCDWAFALLELSAVPHWMFTVSDEYNCGRTNAHYWQTYITYNLNAHRIQLGWGRTRAGYNCSGGVCRYIPETKGFTLSYNYNF